MSSVGWGAYMPAAFLISVTPGANQLLGFRNACHFGWSAAMIAVIGRLLGLGLLTTVVALGLGELLARSATLFDAVRWVGVAYLVYLAIGAWRRSFEVDRGEAPADDGPAATSGTARLTRQEFTVCCTNPKALPLFAALLPASVHGSGSPTVGLLLAGLGFIAVECVTATGYIATGAYLRSAGVFDGRDAILLRVTGTCLLAFAVLLALLDRGAHG